MAFASLATRLVTKYGRDFTLRRITPSTPGPGGTQTGGSQADQVVRGFLQDSRIVQIPGGLSVRSARTVTVAAAGLPGGTPDTNDRLLDGARVMEIQAVRVIDAEGGPVAYVLEVAA